MNFVKFLLLLLLLVLLLDFLVAFDRNNLPSFLVVAKEIFQSLRQKICSFGCNKINLKPFNDFSSTSLAFSLFKRIQVTLAILLVVGCLSNGSSADESDVNPCGEDMFSCNQQIKSRCIPLFVDTH